MVKKIEEMSYDPEVIGLYDKERMDKLVHDIDVKYAKEDGIEQGSKQEKIAIAKNMVKDKVPTNTIIKYTNLTKQEIESLK